MKKLFFFILLPFCLYSCEGQEYNDNFFCEEECCKHSGGLLSIGFGIWNVFPGKAYMTQYQLDYKWGASWYGVQPLGSFMLTDKGSFYFCFGACYDIYLGCRFAVLTPSFAPGLYIRNSGKDLGYPLEFRSSLALSYEFDNWNRVGVQFYHISNASLGHRNPGIDCLVFYYAFSTF
jgi:hypothetical protein